MSIFKDKGMARLYALINEDNPGLIEPVDFANATISSVRAYSDPDQTGRDTIARLTFKPGAKIVGNIEVTYHRIDLNSFTGDKKLELDLYTMETIGQDTLERYIEDVHGFTVDLDYFNRKTFPVTQTDYTYTAKANNPIYTGSFTLWHTAKTQRLNNGFGVQWSYMTMPSPQITSVKMAASFTWNSDKWRVLPANKSIGTLSSNGYGLRNGMYLHRLDIYNGNSYQLLIGLYDKLGSNVEAEDYPDRIVMDGVVYNRANSGSTWTNYTQESLSDHQANRNNGDPKEFEFQWDFPTNDLYNLTWGMDFSDLKDDLYTYGNSKVISNGTRFAVMNKVLDRINMRYGTNYNIREDASDPESLKYGWINNYAVPHSVVSDANPDFNRVIIYRGFDGSQIRGYFLIHYNY